MKYLIIGKNGQLGCEFVKKLEEIEKDFVAVDINELNIEDFDGVLSFFQTIKPSVVINCSAYNQVDLAEERFDRAYKTNAFAVRNLAYGCLKHNAFLVHYGSDYVFDGTKQDSLYTEDDKINPINEYGKSKYMGEVMVKDCLEKYLIFRLSWVFGYGQQNFIYKFLQWCKSKSSLSISSDEVSIPTFTKTVVDVTLKSIDKGITGLYHLTNSGYASRYEWAKFIVKIMKLNNIVYPVSKDVFNLPAKRPAWSPMDNKKISDILHMEIPFWEDDVKEYLANVK